MLFRNYCIRIGVLKKKRNFYIFNSFHLWKTGLFLGHQKLQLGQKVPNLETLQVIIKTPDKSHGNGKGNEDLSADISQDTAVILGLKKVSSHVS